MSIYLSLAGNTPALCLSDIAKALVCVRSQASGLVAYAVDISDILVPKILVPVFIPFLM